MTPIFSRQYRFPPVHKEEITIQVDDNDTFMTSQEKMTSKKIFTRNKQENSKNKVKPLKRRLESNDRIRRRRSF